MNNSHIRSDIKIINGPNLNLLGQREQQHYDNLTLDQINRNLSAIAEQAQLSIDFFQSNAESELISEIHKAPSQGIKFIIINPAAYTHTSIALRDALLAVDIPFIEVHLSNLHNRESFRHHSYFSDIAQGVISGLGPFSYNAALLAAINLLNHQLEF